VFMMFLVGLEFEFGLLRRMGRTAAAVSTAGVALPFALGLGLAQFLHPHLAADRDHLGFTLFMAIALSITAMPVLARIMLELKLTRTRIGVLAITAAAVGDAIGWLLLAGIIAAVRGEFDPWLVAIMLAETIAFVLGVLFVVRPLAKRWIRSLQLGTTGELTAGQFASVIAAVFAAALATNTIGIFAIFGPFVLGASLWDEVEFRDAMQRRLGDFVMVFFLPIFFTLTGLRTRIETLNDANAWLWCGVILAAAIIGKLVGCGLSARLSRQFTWAESASIGVMMNTRGLMELIVINLGRELGVLPDSVFCMLVIMAVVTTYMTAPLLTRLTRHEPEMLTANS
ncbi:MAG: cation:proton antiporter, partial [Planctomycetaceae bacterium]|nr:cation:proton antiporter [Planctomycetaceae bacterium]